VFENDPIDRLPEVVAVLLGRHADRLSPYDRQQLELRLDRGDWIWSDVEDVRRLLPRCMRNVLS
jgi:hypothetical protein